MYTTLQEKIVEGRISTTRRPSSWILQSLSSTSSLSLRNLNIPQKNLVNLIQPDVNTDVFLEMSPPTEDLVTIVARKGLFFHSKSPDITFEWFERLFFVYIESLGITFPGNSEVAQPQVPLKMRFFGKTISAEVALEGRHFAWMTIFKTNSTWSD